MPWQKTCKQCGAGRCRRVPMALCKPCYLVYRARQSRRHRERWGNGYSVRATTQGPQSGDYAFAKEPLIRLYARRARAQAPLFGAQRF
jgi:hypothetical protein